MIYNIYDIYIYDTRIYIYIYVSDINIYDINIYDINHCKSIILCNRSPLNVALSAASGDPGVMDGLGMSKSPHVGGGRSHQVGYPLVN